MRFALRQLIKSPGFTIVAILTLALGIGVNTAMFSVVNTLLYPPAPYPDAERVVRLFRTATEAQNWPMSLPDLRDTAEQSESFVSITPFQWWSFSLAESGQPAEAVGGAIAAANLFTTLGVQPALGRGFTAEEQQVGRDRVAVISDHLWHHRFAADPQIIGRQVRVNGENVEIIGVLPAAADYPQFWGRVDLWRPLPLAQDWRENRDVRWLEAIARLQPGVAPTRAEAELSAIAGRLAQQYPDTNAGQNLRLVPLVGSEVDAVHRNVTWLTLGLAGFVLLIACANLGNLQLARSAARARDLAIRTALGASRGRLVGRMMAESIVLALVGGALGLLLAHTITESLAPHLLDGNTSGTSFPLDARVFGFAAAIAVLAGVLTGGAPAWLAARADVNAGLKQQARGSTGDRSRHHIRQGLIVAQLAFSLTLLAGAGFFIRGLQQFMAHDPGWQVEGLLKGTMTLPESTYPDDPARHLFHERVLAQVARLPGVDHAALATSLPLVGYNSPRAFIVEGRPAPTPGLEPMAYGNIVSSDYFSTLAIPVLEGRVFSPSTGPDDPHQILINETMARRFWPDESAIGKRIRDTSPGWHPWLEIVGVVRDVAYPGNFGAVPSRLQIYLNLAQNPWGYFTVVLRSRSPEALIEPLRRAVAELDAELPVVELRPVATAIAHAQSDLVVASRLLMAFALLGLGLAALGIYGVISALVVQRTPEFGIRMALGAQRSDVLTMVLRHSAVLVAIGAGSGLVIAALTLRVLGHLIPGLPGADPLVLLVVVGILTTVALLACWLPARRATKVDPLVALRAE